MKRTELKRTSLMITLSLALIASALAGCTAEEEARESFDADADVTRAPDSSEAAEDDVAPAPLAVPEWDATVPLGGARPARVLLPDTYSTNTPWPVVVLLHGYGATGSIQDAYLGLSRRRSEYGFITIIPDGTANPEGQRFWNATEACCDFAINQVDDVAYLTGLLDEAAERLAIDPDRIYFLGHSNGGFMSYRMACELGSRIAAVTSIAGSTFNDPGSCKNPGNTNVLQIHGTQDTVIEYDGGLLAGRPYPSAREIVDRWASRHQCDSTPVQGTSMSIVQTIAGEETRVLEWQGCTEGNSVMLWTLEEGNHTPAFTRDFMDKVLDFLLSSRRN